MITVGLTPVEIECIAKAFAMIDLERQGFAWKQNQRVPGSTDLQATKGSEGRLVQVRAAVHPRTPPGLGHEETAQIKSRASQLGCDPWLAQITLNPSRTAAETITWTKVE
jgi:hypothetical protein